MKIRKPGAWVLWCEGAGFGLIVFLAWLNEIGGLSHVLFQGPEHIFDGRELAAETGVIVIIGAIVILLTRRLLLRLHYLERFLRVCAWCRKLGHGECWMPVEDFFKQGFQVETTHGVCPECLKKLEEDTKRFHRKDTLGQQAATTNSDSARGNTG